MDKKLPKERASVRRLMGKNVLIVQPWFCAKGHPAQSVINMASAIGRDDCVEYLVSIKQEDKRLLNLMMQLEALACTHSYDTFDADGTGKRNTAKALMAIARLRIKGRCYRHVFFFDASLLVLALLWPLCAFFILAKRLSVLHVSGPEFANKSRIKHQLVRSLLMRKDVTLYLRTEELAQAWKASYRGEVRHLPSLEIPDNGRNYSAPDVRRENGDLQDARVRFGIIGQIRPGKGINWLVPLFQGNPLIGDLTVAGAFYNRESRLELSVLEGFEGFINSFMLEDEMLERASEQDYLLMLYDQDWDPRLESAILYLAARVNRPVIVYADSWSGRMVKEFGCGLLADSDHKATAKLLHHVPRPLTAEYANLLKGMDVFRKAHSVEALRGVVIQELLD